MWGFGVGCRVHQRARLEDDLLGLGVLGDVRREADSRGSLARGVDAARRDAVHVREQL